MIQPPDPYLYLMLVWARCYATLRTMASSLIVPDYDPPRTLGIPTWEPSSSYLELLLACSMQAFAVSFWHVHVHMCVLYYRPFPFPVIMPRAKNGS